MYMYRSPFTKVKRHTYIDPDYTYTDSEAADIKCHKDSYRDYLCEERRKRLAKEKNKYAFNVKICL